MDYGLSAMTGVLPTILVAGFATKMTQSLFPTTRPPRKRKKSRRKSSRRLGDFRNVGF